MAYMLATVNETEQSDDKIDPEAIRKGLVRWERGKACRREAANDDSALPCPSQSAFRDDGGGDRADGREIQKMSGGSNSIRPGRGAMVIEPVVNYPSR
jgi:hypothetical protein